MPRLRGGDFPSSSLSAERRYELHFALGTGVHHRQSGGCWKSWISKVISCYFATIFSTYCTLLHAVKITPLSIKACAAQSTDCAAAAAKRQLVSNVACCYFLLFFFFAVPIALQAHRRHVAHPLPCRLCRFQFRLLGHLSLPRERRRITIKPSP